MREYKFRVYDKDRQKTYYLLENRRSFGTSEFDRAVDWEDVFADKHEELVIMQYTGLKDKNGKEIYEGDIVYIKGDTEILDIKGKVEYSETFAEYIITNTGDIINEAEPLGDYDEDIEVIGNIYDNSDLLEKGAEE